MRVVALKTIKDFWKKHSDSEQQLKAWYDEVIKSEWNKFDDVLKDFPNARIIKNNRIIFNIKGNNYRLIVAVKFEFKILYVRFIGTHAQYDKIKAEEI
jgi:mRNA interferase HigB